MFTVLMTLVGIVVFIISLLTASFKAAFKRLMLFTIFGLLIDVILFTCFAVATYVSI